MKKMGMSIQMMTIKARFLKNIKSAMMRIGRSLELGDSIKLIEVE
jgi:hypothetical protein